MELDVIERLKKVLFLLKTETDLSRVLNERDNTLLSSTTGRRPPGFGIGGNNNDKFLKQVRERLKELTVPKSAQKVIDEELQKLQSLDPVFNATEHYTCRNYLNWLIHVPWGVYTNDNLDLGHAESKIIFLNID
jgi:ATP-dependent Lon protease